MTRNQDIVSRTQQLWWWIRLPKTTHPFVVTERMYSVVGYGLVSGDGGLSGGLLPAARGYGLGTFLFQHLLDFAQERSLTPWLEVFEGNTRARNLYKKLGFVERSRSDNVILLDHVDTRVRVVS